MNFNLIAFLNCFDFYEVTDQKNTLSDEGLTYTFTLTDDQLLVDKIVDFNEFGNPEMKSMRLPLPSTFEEAIELFRENDLCFLNICNDAETIEDIKEDYYQFCGRAS